MALREEQRMVVMLQTFMGINYRNEYILLQYSDIYQIAIVMYNNHILLRFNMVSHLYVATLTQK
jgi:hypothetical protein